MNTVLSFFPYVLNAVKAVEDAYAAEPGANKKQIVLDSVLAAARVGESVPNAEVALLSALIDSTVTMLNASGLFTHKPPVAPSPTPTVAPAPAVTK